MVGTLENYRDWVKTLNEVNKLNEGHWLMPYGKRSIHKLLRLFFRVFCPLVPLLVCFPLKKYFKYWNGLLVTPLSHGGNVIYGWPLGMIVCILYFCYVKKGGMQYRVYFTFALDLFEFNCTKLHCNSWLIFLVEKKNCKMSHARTS